MTEHSEEVREIAVGIQAGNKCNYDLAKILGLRLLSKILDG